MKDQTVTSRALSKIEAMDTERGVGGARQRAASQGHDIPDAKREVYRKSQAQGSIAYIESPAPGEADIASVLIVTGGGLQLRVALGRNRTANLISQLVASLT